MGVADILDLKNMTVLSVPFLLKNYVIPLVFCDESLDVRPTCAGYTNAIV